MEAVIGIAIFAGVVVPIGFAWYREARGHRQQAVLAAQEGTKATGLATQLADMTNRHDKEKKRAEAANKTIQSLLAKMASAPAAGSWASLVSIIEAARAAEGGDGDGTLHLPAGADGGSDWALLEPGQDP